LRVQYHQRWEA